MISALRQRWFTQLSDALGDGEWRIDIDAILCHVMKCSREQLLAGLVQEATPERLHEVEILLKRRASGEPLAYIVNSKEFYGREFYVTPAVLIPRPETELLVERALVALRKQSSQLVEVGVGSGAVLLTLLAEGGAKQGMGSDISGEALLVCKENAKRLGVSAELIHCDLLPPGFSPTGHTVLVSNPPYIEDSYVLPRGVTFEPDLALFAGPDGLTVYRRLFDRLKDFRDSLSVCLEIGANQAHHLALLVQGIRGEDFQLFQDLAGRDRVVTFNLNCR